LVVTILAVAVLSLGGAATAGSIADIPCEECAEASDPVEFTSLLAEAVAKREASIAASTARYTGLAQMYAEDREMSVASEGSVALGIPADPTWLVPLNSRAVARREASTAASAARYSALAEMYAVERETDAASEAPLALGIPSDPTQLVPLSARAVARREASVAASAARYSALADLYAADRETAAATEASLALGIPADPTWLMPLDARADADSEMDAAFLSYAARLEALADCYALTGLICSVK
jgi:hypothetical protein